MDEYLDAFVEAHPYGWNHQAWLELLAQLEENDCDVSQPKEIGYELEKRRLVWELRRRKVPGLGPKRIEAVVERFGTFWSLQQADAGQLAEIRSIPRALAEKVVAALRDV